VWIQPAAGDAGGALGAALSVWYEQNDRPVPTGDAMQGAFLGPSIAIKNTKKDDAALEALGGVWETFESGELAQRVAELIARGKIVGVARRRMEWGPRALGNRSILANAQLEDTQQKLNEIVKRRESFRPFAPMVLKEDAADYFDMEGASPYMLFTCPVREGAGIPAVTHVDGSARVQTVDRDNAFSYNVLRALKRLTGCGVMVNTSFNVRGEPIVNTAQDAYRCFMDSGLDYAAIGNRLFDKAKQRRDDND